MSSDLKYKNFLCINKSENKKEKEEDKDHRVGCHYFNIEFQCKIHQNP